ncbi:MAG TPA: DnaJ domain-containing protein [Candidatus Limnocylindrales bacterium]|nr:DnaJ domain-containing protein [Candidatus Limnocylindrales bacterium]
MTTAGDPWRTLGLPPGASLDDVRRAYRRLAKANHPDAAGEAALPRFLAIQAAYEAIAGPARGRRLGGRPGPGGARPNPPSEPWRADPERARASGRADGRRPGARPTGRPGAGARPRAAGEADGAGEPRGPAGPAGPSTGSSAGSERTRGPSAGRSRRSSRRQPKTATPYSTSYDPADEEPFEPGWSGGSWYGASSGTYWTINPKEYADPRKHGPEYQARARRSRDGWILDDEEAETGEAGAADPGQPPAGPSAAPPADPSPSSQAAGPRRPPARQSAASSAGIGGPGDAPPQGSVPDRSAGPQPSNGFQAPLLPAARTATARAGFALLGWPPLALFAASAIGETTGCGRYAASCAELSAPGTWIVSLAILIVLLALPAVARWSAHGTVAMLVIGVPAAVVLSAAGGTNLREASAPMLLGVLALADLGGVLYAVAFGRSRPEAGSGASRSLR